MITVKLYGLIRIESGIKEKQLDVKDVKQLLTQLAETSLWATLPSTAHARTPAP